MNFRDQFNARIPGFAKYIESQNLQFLIASGNSASDFADDVKNIASSHEMRIPTIHKLSREESRSMYMDPVDDPISILSNSLPYLFKEICLESPVLINFLDDYSRSANKVIWLNDSLQKLNRRNKFSPTYIFRHYIMVANTAYVVEKLGELAKVYEVNQGLVEWRDEIYNPNTRSLLK